MPVIKAEEILITPQPKRGLLRPSVVFSLPNGITFEMDTVEAGAFWSEIVFNIGKAESDDGGRSLDLGRQQARALWDQHNSAPAKR